MSQFDCTSAVAGEHFSAAVVYNTTMLNQPAITFSMVEPDIAEMVFDMPGRRANILSALVRAQLADLLDELETRTDLAGLIVRSGKPRTFLVGADLGELAANADATVDDVRTRVRDMQRLFVRLSRLPFPTVAAVDGPCFGGGAELAVWCDRRIAADDPRTQFGFPEVKLGLLPGGGGTVRTPRVVGLRHAIDLIVPGEPIGAARAVAIRLVDEVVPPGRLVEAAVRSIRSEQASGDYLHDRRRWNAPVRFDPAELDMLQRSTRQAIATDPGPRYPAPAAALDVLLAGYGEDVPTACRGEAEAFTRLFGSPVNRAMMNVFFLTDFNRRDSGIRTPGIEPQSVGLVGVIGAGIMGASIAALNLKSRIPVKISDLSRKLVSKGIETAVAEASYDPRLDRANDRVGRDAARWITGLTDSSQLADCDLVIESATEQLDLKRELFAELEPRLRPEAVLATNTSSIPINRLAESLERPERFCGMHFFNPVPHMRLVEIIRGRQTDDRTIATAVAYAKQIGKWPVVVADGPGFLVNRLLHPYLSEAMELLVQGVPMQTIDAAAVAFGMPIGPIAVCDLIGLDTAYYAGRTFWAAFPDRTSTSPIVPALIKAGRLGRKTGCGFYRYEENNGAGRVDPATLELIAPYLAEPAGRGPRLDRRTLTNRLFLPMLVEATRVLEENIVRSARDIDLGMIFGLAFPEFRGGLLYWADTLGADRIVEMLKPLSHLGQRAEPTPLLREMAADGSKFYSYRGFAGVAE